MKTQSIQTTIAEKMRDRLEVAIDAIIALEGTVYPNGLPTDFSRALARLRSDRNRYNEALALAAK